MSKETMHFETMSIHAAAEKDQHQALNSPIYMTSTFTFNDIQEAQNTFDFKRKAYVYSRGGNPTINLFEKRLAALESGADGVAFSSGMGAITGVLLSLVEKNEMILAHKNLYGSSFTAINELFPRFGIKSNFVDMTDLNQIREKITDDIKVIYFETPTNPMLEIIDIVSVVKIAKEHGIKVVVDNTFSSPFFQRPLELGVDVVVHSATKYISGHGDVVAGIAVSKDTDYIAKLKFGYMCELGTVLSPFNAWLVLRGIKTLGLRMERHELNAKKMVEFLSSHPKVEKVYYPGLANHPGHEIAKKQMNGFGAIVSFELTGDEKSAEKCIKNMNIPKLAVSLGDVETLIEIPIQMTHRAYLEKENNDIPKKLIRISLGLEHYADMISDLEQALDKTFR